MANVLYDYVNQRIQASCQIQPLDNDAFYNPVRSTLTGFAADGYWYDLGVQNSALQASWFTEVPSTFRGPTPAFPSSGIILLSRVALVILDESQPGIPMWMVFLLGDSYALANNFGAGLDGFTPTNVAYCNGVITVLCVPDVGASTQSNLAVHLDFINDHAWVEFAN